MTIGTLLYTLFCGAKKGQDRLGNRYYQGKDGKRWVLYAKGNDASSVPPSWYGWLHYTHDDVLGAAYPWQHEHEPNYTGTRYAYFPPGHLNAPKGQPYSAVPKEPYVPWAPSKEDR
jgi:NADH:ubiquinone oxidoreductase subunit